MPENKIKPARISTTTFRVPYGHTDQMGHVYYGQYLLFFEMARNDWMRSGGLTYRDFEKSGYFVPVAEAHVNYKGSVYYDDVIVICCSAHAESRVKMKFTYEIYRAEDNTLKNNEKRRILASGWSMHVVTTKEGRPVRIPKSIMELL